MSLKPFSQSCENNKDPILQVIREVFSEPGDVWEIGSGTGQHACYFAERLPHLQWRPTDRPEYLQGINLWREEAKLSNLSAPLPLDVNEAVWPCQAIAGLFTANTLHIMSNKEVGLFFAGLDAYLQVGAYACLYGPFNYHGAYTSDSNARFDQWLKTQHPLSCIKDSETVLALAADIGCRLVADTPMPANNRLLVLQRSEKGKVV